MGNRNLAKWFWKLLQTYLYLLANLRIHNRRVRVRQELICQDGSIEHEYWRIGYYRGLLPKYDGFAKSLPCGCTKQFGRVKYMRSDCPEHFGFWDHEWLPPAQRKPESHN